MDQLIHMADTPWGWAALALIAFGDTLIGVGFFVFGELAFLTAGALFATTGSPLPALIVLLAGWCGDLASFALGRRAGPRVVAGLMPTPKRRRAWRQSKSALTRHGATFVILSRLLGPTAWITPFFAGVSGMRPTAFAAASCVGAILGIGQFLVFGAVGINVLTVIWDMLAVHLWAVLTALMVVLCAAFVWRRCRAGLLSKITRSTGAGIALFLTINASYFFLFNLHSVEGAPAPSYASVCEARTSNFLVTPGDTALHLPQPVNLLYLSPRSGADLMADLGWQRNKTFSRDDISFVTYLRLLWNNTPPVSELYLAGAPANSAFQLPGTLKQREHIRWWTAGSFSFGAISQDEEVAIKYYRHLPVILHDIHPDVDRSRDMLATQIAAHPELRVLGYAPLGTPVVEDLASDYETDGRVLVVTDATAQIPQEILTCLAVQPRAHPTGPV
jgi:membrane protein DedA with SNARE-associated domain